MKNLKLFKNISIVILSLLIYSGISAAQNQVVLVDYPLTEDLVDDTGNNNDAFLQGNPTAPIAPSNGIELCGNGIYLTDPDGQDIITPIMPTLNIHQFSIEVDFKVIELPEFDAERPRMPIIMGSKFARWLGIYINSDGILGFKHNNNNYEWSTTAIDDVGIWYSSKITYVNGHVELFLEDQLILTDDVGPLVTFQNTFNFTITDFSEGNPFYGCIRNLKISSAPDDVFKNGFE